MEGRDRLRETDSSLGVASYRELWALASEDDEPERVVFRCGGFGGASSSSRGSGLAASEVADGRRSPRPAIQSTAMIKERWGSPPFGVESPALG